MSDSAKTFIAQEKSRYSNELKKIESARRKALENSQFQVEEINKLRRKLDEMQSMTNSNADPSSAQQLNSMIDRFRELEKQHHALQVELNDKRSLEQKYASLSAERDAANARVFTCEAKITALTQTVDRCNDGLLQARISEERAQVQVGDLRNQSETEISELSRKLSQAEERAKYAEAGLVQMKTSAEKTILEEQETHRKRQEALQQRLDEAQSELQTKSEEADEHRAFVERTVTQQQTVWQRLHTELETKTSDYKTQLDETTQLLQKAQEEQSSLQTTIASLQGEIRQHHRAETERMSQQHTSEVITDDLRHQLDAAQAEISSLQAVQQRYLREKDERSSREARAKVVFETLRRDHDAAKATIADLEISEKKSRYVATEQKQRKVDIQRKLDDMRNECDTAQAALRELRGKHAERQSSHNVVAAENHQAVLQPEPVEQSSIEEFVQPSRLGLPAVPRQRKRADRTTNTIVQSDVGHSRATTGSARSESVPDHAQVVIPATLASSTMPVSSSHDDMLDIVSSQSRGNSKSQLVGSTQTEQGFNENTVQDQASTSQVFPASLDFSGKPLVATNDQLTKGFYGREPSRSNSSSDFKIYEDSQNLLNEHLNEEDPVRANFTFRKPLPLPNSGSKRLTRTTSDRSLDASPASTHDTRRTPENSGCLSVSQSNKTPEVSKYPFGSSPEFMNPPSTKTKRRYSGGPTPLGNIEPRATRRSSTLLPDPRVVARPGRNERVVAEDVQSQNMETPTKKRHVTQTAAKPKSRLPSEDSFIGRSSQSVNDLPRIEDLNAGRVPGQTQSSRMRTSAGSRRITRNQKANKGQCYDLAYT